MTRKITRFAIGIAAGLMLVPAPRVAADEPKATLEAKGYLIAHRRLSIGTEVTGRVTEVLFEEGQKFRKGDILARLDDSEARVQLQHAEAGLELAHARLALAEKGAGKHAIGRAQANLDEAEANAKLREVELARYEALMKTTPGAISTQELAAAKAAHQVAQAQLQKARLEKEALARGPSPEQAAIARAEIKQAEAQVILAKVRLDKYVLRAPIDGTVLIKNVEVGTVVGPTAYSLPAAICEMANLHELDVSIDVQERDVRRISIGLRCRITPDAYPKDSYEGQLTRMMPVADRSKGAVNFRIRLTIPASDDKLIPDLGVIVRFLAKE